MQDSVKMRKEEQVFCEFFALYNNFGKKIVKLVFAKFSFDSDLICLQKD